MDILDLNKEQSIDFLLCLSPLKKQHWILRKPMAEICRDAIRDYLKKKLPKDQVKKFGL